MSAFAMFSLKDSSLLAFQDRQGDPSLKSIYKINSVPSDSQMRDILDPIDVQQRAAHPGPAELRIRLHPWGQAGDHADLFDQIIQAGDESRYHCVKAAHPKGKTETTWVKDLPLNKSNEDIRINYIGQGELSPEGDVRSMFGWVTDQKTTAPTVGLLARGGRCRWRIENETFNTLKNQDDHFEHNYGHGKKHLSTVLMLLMMLAFLVDQVQQLCCPLFGAVLEKVKTRKSLWRRLRSAVESFAFPDGFRQDNPSTP